MVEFDPSLSTTRALKPNFENNINGMRPHTSLGICNLKKNFEFVLYKVYF